MRTCVRACVRVCVRACVRACVRVCVCVCVFLRQSYALFIVSRGAIWPDNAEEKQQQRHRLDVSAESVLYSPMLSCLPLTRWLSFITIDRLDLANRRPAVSDELLRLLKERL